MTDKSPRPSSPWLDFRRKRFWAVLLLLTYLLGLGGIAPMVLRGQIAAQAGKALDRPVTLEAVRVNPFTLAIELRGMQVREKKGDVLFGFERLRIRPSLDGLFRRSWSIGDITLSGFRGKFVQFANGANNITALFPAPKQPAQEEKSDLRLVVHHLAIDDARFSVTDLQENPLFATEIGPLNAEIEQLSTLPDESGKQHVVIGFEKGARLEIVSESGLDPLRSQGHITLKGAFLPLLGRFLQPATGVALPSGEVEAALDFRLQPGAQKGVALAVENLAIALRDVVLAERQDMAGFLTLPQLQLKGGHFAWPERQAGAESLSIEGVRLAARREADGSLMPVLPAAQATAPQPEPQPQPGPAWSIEIGKIALDHGNADFEDHAPREVAHFALSDIALTVEKLSNRPEARTPFTASAKFAPKGQVTLQGRLALAGEGGIEAKAELAGLPLSLLQPYLHEFGHIAIDDGGLDSAVTATTDGKDGLKIAGQAVATSLRLSDEFEKQPLLSWRRLGVEKFVLRPARQDLQISQITLDEPSLRFHIDADHSTNLSHALLPPRKDRSADSQPAANPMTAGVGRVVISGGSADFADASLPLPFATHISQFQGHLAAIESSAKSPSSLSLQGQIDQFGEVEIFGKVNPFQPTRDMKLNVKFRNVAFPGLSPYSAKFAGRRIAKGKLDVDSRYVSEAGRLSGSNRVVIRDMELGDRIDVPGALDLPLELAIALLKDADGKIDIDLPVSGNVDDPQFDFGGVVAKALADMVLDLVSSPFRALAALFGGAAEGFDQILFMPGRASLEPPEREKLKHVAESLGKRPDLKLVIAGVMDEEADRNRLQRDALDEEMAQQLGDGAMIDQQRRFLETLFDARLGKEALAAARQPYLSAAGDATTIEEPAYLADLRRKLAKSERIDDAALEALASTRGKAVAEVLTKGAGFDARRIITEIVSPVKAREDGRIPMSLEVRK